MARGPRCPTQSAGGATTEPLLQGSAEQGGHDVHELLSSLLPDWLRDRRPDPNHFHRRRFTRRHRAKMRIVKKLWIGTGLITLINPVLPFAVTAGIIATLTSFVILDETE